MFFKMSEERDRSFVKICDLEVGGMTQQWLVREAKIGFESSQESYRLIIKTSGEQEGKDDGKGSQLVTAVSFSTERLNQEVCETLQIQLKHLFTTSQRLYI